MWPKRVFPMDVIVTSNVGINITVLEIGLLDGSILGRPIVIVDRMPLSDRNLKADIASEDLIVLRNHPKVLQVERVEEMGIRTRNRLTGSDNINPVLSATVNATHDNWGLEYCAQGLGSTVYNYSHQGQGVDVVIVDSGIYLSHSEFEDGSFVSRIQQIEWEAGMLTAKPNFYSDQDGHGTHVAGTVSGKTQGWAKDARIYSMKIFDTDAYTNPLTALQLVRAWHNAKTGADAGRPTVVNNSWIYSTEYPLNYPDVALRETLHPVRVASVDAEIDSMDADGIIVVCAAGNDEHYVADPSDTDYNDYYQTDGSFNWVPNGDPSAVYVYYYNRLTPGGATSCLCTASMGESSKTEPSWFTNKGTAVDIWAPGRNIQSAKVGGGFQKLSGTSMASPQVAGIAAVYLSMFPTTTHAEFLQYLQDFGDADMTGVLDSSVNLTAHSLYNTLYQNQSSEWKSVKPHVLDSSIIAGWQNNINIFIKDSGTWTQVLG
jgi:subtilisin family serine protease